LTKNKVDVIELYTIYHPAVGNYTTYETKREI